MSRFVGNRFGQRCFAVSRRSREQHTVTRLHSMGAQDIRSSLFLDQFVACAAHCHVEIKFAYRPPWLTLLNASRTVPHSRNRFVMPVAVTPPWRIQSPCDPVRNARMLFGSFVGGDCFGRRAHISFIACDARFHEIDDKIAPRHGPNPAFLYVTAVSPVTRSVFRQIATDLAKNPPENLFLSRNFNNKDIL
jgi:hypothetical protein